MNDIVRFELTEEESERYRKWAQSLLKDHIDEGVEGLEITMCFNMSALGISVEAICGSERLVLREALD